MAGTRLSELAHLVYLALLIIPVSALPGPNGVKGNAPARKYVASQTLGSQCGGRNYNGATTCPTSAYCSTENSNLAVCAPYTLYSTTVTSGNKLFTTTVTTSSKTLFEVITPEGTTTRTVTIPANSSPYTSTVQATGYSSVSSLNPSLIELPLANILPGYCNHWYAQRQFFKLKLKLKH